MSRRGNRELPAGRFHGGSGIFSLQAGHAFRRHVRTRARWVLVPSLPGRRSFMSRLMRLEAAEQQKILASVTPESAAEVFEFIPDESAAELLGELELGSPFSARIVGIRF